MPGTDLPAFTFPIYKTAKPGGENKEAGFFSRQDRQQTNKQAIKKKK